MQTNIIQDIPLYDPTDDKFGREPIVDLIVGSINQVVSEKHPCMVYGIYGKWGEGKTSLMNFVKKKLTAQGRTDGIVINEFNPWLVNNDEALLQEFFKTIMTDTDDLVRAAFKKYGSLAIFASKTIVNAAAPGVGSALAKGIEWAKEALEDSSDSLSELKKKASEAIVKSGKHLIVMIDDVDRLDKEELHTVMRLIRQVADFDNCIYIISMDVDMVAKSIADYHGNGTLQDGRKFIDKIVQVPITLPKVPQCDMFRLVRDSLADTLQDSVEDKQLDEISHALLPFIGTYRELKRYCNQLAFILPSILGEVNIQDLCLLEAIKMVSAESYMRIYERGEELRHIVRPFSNKLLNYMTAEKKQEEAEKNFEAAKEYVTQGIDGQISEVISDTLDELFESSSINYQEDVDKKRLDTDVYFQKYFTQLVPGDIIPDRELDAFMKRIQELNEDEIANQFDKWLDKFSAAEVKSAAIYLIRSFEDGDKRYRAASMAAKALSLCKLAKDLPPHVYVDPDKVSSFVANQVIYEYMFVRDDKFTRKKVWNADLLDETLGFIFENAEMNYCMNLLCSSEDIFVTGIYDGHKALPVLTRRFVEMGFIEQFRYSKTLLDSLFGRWKRADAGGFNQYANYLFSNSEIPLGEVMNKFIACTDDLSDLTIFVELFKSQIPQINERLPKESKEVRESPAAKIYASYYRQILEQYHK